MRIGLIDVDSHNFPNLALMKLSAYHKAIGDRVEWWNGFLRYDRVYQSKIFDDTYSPDMEFCINADEIIKGGSGYDLDNRLPDEIEHIMPDYGLYCIKDTAYGFLTRGCPRKCPFCITSEKDGRRSMKVYCNNWQIQRQRSRITGLTRDSSQRKTQRLSTGFGSRTYISHGT